MRTSAHRAHTMKKLLLPLVFVALGTGAWMRAHAARAFAGYLAPGAVVPAPAQGGSFPQKWINGVDCSQEPDIQVHPYNDDFYILRQSKCTSFEAPFVYLIFGIEKVLMIDTGSIPNPAFDEVVDRVIDAWLLRNGQADIELIVAHSHSHIDHIGGDFRFVGRPNTTVVGLSRAEVMSFFRFTRWPDQFREFDLGGRVLDVFPTPGHQSASLTFYDRRTQLLLTGDIIYPGHLFVFTPPEWDDFTDSLRRISRFIDRNPVTWILGCHIEMTSQPFGCLPWGTKSHPDEHVLQLPPTIATEILGAARSMSDDPQCVVYEEFVMHPVWKCGIAWCP